LPTLNDSAVASTDSSLVAGLKSRDGGAWRRFVDLYAPWIFSWARRFGLTEVDAADVTQETLLAVYRSIGNFQRVAPGDSFRGWLWTIMRSKISDRRRRAHLDAGAGGSSAQARLALVPEQIPEAPPEDADQSAEDDARRLLQRALAQVRDEFEERTWRAFWEVVVEGRSPADVAAELGVSANAVRQSKSRVLRRLRAQLGDA
jgi:RNA polymerase sigma-70 factor (ECF subfamily)